MIALEYLSAIRFSGTEAGDFLHNQLSSDVLGLSDAGSVFACYCEPKGRVLALMLVCRVNEDFYVVMSSTLASTVSNRLKMYVMRSKVVIDVLSEATVAGSFVPDSMETRTDTTITIPLPDNGQFLSISTDETALDHKPSAVDTWKASELEKGICWLCPESSAQFLPQMLGFDQLGAVNFRKGCYPGQEIVARTHYLGKVKRHPRMLKFTAADCPEILDKIQILSDEQSYEAIVVDCVRNQDNRISLFVITRMDPELTAREIEYQGQVVTLA